jgi:hypothetical protein
LSSRPEPPLRRRSGGTCIFPAHQPHPRFGARLSTEHSQSPRVIGNSWINDDRDDLCQVTFSDPLRWSSERSSLNFVLSSRPEPPLRRRSGGTCILPTYPPQRRFWRPFVDRALRIASLGNSGRTNRPHFARPTAGDAPARCVPAVYLLPPGPCSGAG